MHYLGVCYNEDYNRRYSIFIFIAIIVGTALWLLSGFPLQLDALVTITLTVAGSELLIWKYIFNLKENINSKLSKMDKNTALGFMKVKHDMEKNHIEMNNRFNKIENKLDTISGKLK